MKHKLDAEISKFWLGKNYDTVKLDVESTMDLARLSSYRRAISNFVFILTGKSVPVRFAEQGKSRTDGTVIYIGGELSKGEFDSTVGLALHEAMHIVKSNFGLLESWGKISKSTITRVKPRRGIPISLFKLPMSTLISTRNEISLRELGEFTKYIFNVVEDRYIDAWAYDMAPGYRGYYRALYDKYFNLPEIDVALKSENYRNPTLKNYKFRFTNIINKNSDLDALPGLRQSYELLNLPKILRPELASPEERLELSLNIVEIFVENLIKERERIQQAGQVKSPKEDDLASDEGSWTEDASISNDDGDVKTEEIIKQQESFVERTNKDSGFDCETIKKLNLLEESGIEVINVGNEYNIPEVECVVITRLTKELMESGEFPFASKFKTLSENPDAAKGVTDGIVLGTILGKRLQVRNEVKTTKFSRLARGKIDRRLLSAIGHQEENIFFQTMTDKYKNVFLHISVDASGSMVGNWRKTITMLVAIAKAASMTTNINVSISFRTGAIVGGKINETMFDERNQQEFPYVVIAYDSRIDKFQKIIQLFPMLFAYGSTPEGLTFQAILKHIPDTTYELDSYFINLSDGEPAFGSFYSGEVAANHTKQQVEKIRKKGIDVLSYFINDISSKETSNNSNGSENIFKIMYGKDAQFIDVSNVIQIAHTMNKKFLSNDN